MKKFLVFAALFAAMFLMMSCGGSSSTGGVTYDGDKVCALSMSEEQCNGHNVKVCSEGDKTWYEVEGTGKKIVCNNGDCDKAAQEVVEYCTNGSVEFTDDDDFCVKYDEPCKGEDVWYCVSEDNEDIWYKVGDKTFKCKTDDGCLSAMTELSEYCGYNEDENGESEFETEPTAYLPQSHAGKIIEAWYMLKEADEDKIKIEAVFLFQDFSLVVTSAKVYSAADGRDPEDEIIAEGTFEITSGSYNDGTARVDTGETPFDVTITNGVLSAMGEEFIKQDNGYAPEPR